ncbi:MAG TPA: diacylglycerol kinase family protein [Thermomicrobiales bacterium]|nr:diacylglycerol kinase family protein [Thermomicrobiales bacterium]
MTIPSPSVAVIVNPATHGNVQRVLEILQAEAPHGTRLEVFMTEHAGHASELATSQAAWADVLVAVGGDGTVGEVAGVARVTNKVLGIIPGGSTNIIARELGIPTNVQQAVRLMFHSQGRISLDAGICGDRTFLHMAGMGIDSLLFELADANLKRKVGWMAYLPAAMKALTRPMATYTIRTAERDMVNVKSPLVLIANGRSIIAPQFRLDSRIRFDDGKLDVAVVTATRPDEIARVLARLATRQLFDSPLVEWFTTTEITVEADPPMAVQLDGDVALHTPISISIAPGAVTIIVPESQTRLPSF